MDKKDKDILTIFGIMFGIMVGLPLLYLLGDSIYNSISGTEATKEKIENCITENNFSKARELLPRLDDDQVEYAEKITKSEVTYYIKIDELIRARAIATENNAMHLYQEVFSAEKFPHLIAEKKYEEAFQILSTWVFVKEPVYDVHTTGEETDFGGGFFTPNVEAENREKYEKKKKQEQKELNKVAEYNSEIGTYNDNIFKLFYPAVADNNRAYIKKCLMLFQDELEESSRKPNSEGGYDIKYVKTSKALKEAKQKLNELKIRL